MTARRPDRARALALAAALLLVLAATLLPADEPTGPPGCIACGETWGADALANIVLFLPFGAALVAAGLRAGPAWLTGVALSAAIELAQARLIPGRDGNVGDIIANGLGAALGVLLARHAVAVLWPRRRRLAALGAAAVAPLVVLATGLVLRTSLPRSTWWGQWTPQFGNLAWYDGRVTAAAVGGIALPDGRLAVSGAARAALLRGDTLAVRFTAGTPPAHLAPVFAMADDDRRGIIMLGVNGYTAVLRVRRAAADLRLLQPAIVLPGALRRLPPGATATLSAWRAGMRWCLEVDDGPARCGTGLTAGGGWRLLVGASRAYRIARFMDAAWLLGLLAIGACWWRGRAAWAGGAVTLVATCGVVPALVGLDPTTAAGWIGGALGVLAGIGLRRALGEAPRPGPGNGELRGGTVTPYSAAT